MEENQNYWNFGLVRLLLDFSLNTTIKVYSWQKWCNPEKGNNKLFTLLSAASTRGSLIALLLLSIIHHHTTHDGYLWIKCINNSISNCLCNNLDRKYPWYSFSCNLLIIQVSLNASFIFFLQVSICKSLPARIGIHRAPATQAAKSFGISTIMPC